MLVEELMERVKHVESRILCFFIIFSATMKGLARWGRVIKD